MWSHKHLGSSYSYKFFILCNDDKRNFHEDVNV
jgi:hypothetical protein